MLAFYYLKTIFNELYLFKGLRGDPGRDGLPGYRGFAGAQGPKGFEGNIGQTVMQ